MSLPSVPSPSSPVVLTKPQAALAEVFSDRMEGAASGFVLAHLAAGARVL